MKTKCQKCKGRGHYSGNLYDLGKREMVYFNYIQCDHPTCKNGFVDPELCKEQHRQILSWGVPSTP